MIQYTGTSSRSNYNDERTATIGLALGSLGGQALDLRPFLAAHLLSSCASSCFSCSFPSPSFPPLSLFTSLYLVSFASASPSGERPRCCAPQQEQTSPRGRHGATESRWMDLSEPFLRSPGIITGPPWGFTGPEVRHQRDTCSTLTIIAAQASALSFFVRSLSYRFFSLSFPFSLSLSCPFRVHDSINVVNASILVFRVYSFLNLDSEGITAKFTPV